MYKYYLYFILFISALGMDIELLTTKDSKYYYKNELYTGSIEEYYFNHNLEKTKNISFEAKIIQGKLNGKSKIYYENGNLYKEENYIDNILEGLNFYYHPNGKLMVVKKYSDGKLLDIYKDVKATIPLSDYFIEYTASGEVLRKIKYVKILSRYNVEIIEYQFISEYERKTFNVNYPSNSTVKLFTDKGKYNLFEQRIGEWKLKYSNGDYLIREYLNGSLNGNYYTYNNKNILIIEETYKFDKKNGVSKLYYDSGKIKNVEYYKNGKLDGECFEYYENGKISVHKIYANGYATGVWRYYHKNGKLDSDEVYGANGYVVEWRTYNMFGKVKKRVNYQEVYKNAKPIMWH
ncbi:MAG: hypothetical protein RR523_11850 [Cetobacterium sp.]|uniref:toxin-antitoxin system YwqK family antitoxin n=1 Tax=Cetobacterium sp. TaxID=2071632 RepID=UPI002FC6D303